MTGRREVSKLGAVAPHHAVPSPPTGAEDSVTWPREGAASPVASPIGKGLKSPRAPLKSAASVRREASVTAREARGLSETPKPRSGSETRQRTHVARLRLDDAELLKLEERASASGLTVGAYLRTCAIETAGVRAKPRPSVDRELLARTNADLNRVGNNINQIAHALNSGRDPPVILTEALGELRSVLTVIRRAAGYDR